MHSPVDRRWPRLLAVTVVALALLASVAPLAAADDAVPNDEVPNSEAPPGATDGIPVGTWEGEPVDGPVEDSGATTAAVTQRYFGADAFHAIEDAVAATSRTCSVSNSNLVAMVLGPVFRESSAAVTPSSEPAPMTLSRYDEWSGYYPPPETNQNTNYGLYAFRDPYTAFPRAYWHPGIGIWQYDSAGVGMPFTAAERIDVRIVSADVAKEMARRYCNRTGTEQSKRNAAWLPWGNPCYECQAAYSDLVSTGFASLTLTDDVDAAGGMLASTCSLQGVSASFTCHYIDPARAQGANWWLFSPDGGSRTSSPTPVSAPFYSFERNGYEERHWLAADTGYPADIFARRRLGTNARPRSNPVGSGLEWGVNAGLCDFARSQACGAALPEDFVRTSLTDRGDAIPLQGDFNGDGWDDLFWYAAGGATDDQWLSSGDTGFAKRTMTVSGTYRPMVGDLDGDGRDDIFWYAPGAAADYIWWSGDKAMSTATNVIGTYQPFVGDFDGNDADEIFWYAPGGARDYVWSWSTGRVLSGRYQPVLGTYQPLLGDFNGDDATDVFWYKAGSGADSLWYGRSGGFTNQAVNVTGTYQPLVGDFDDDRRDDIIWYRAGAASDYTWFGASESFVSVRNDIFGTYEPFVVDLDLASDSGGDDVVFYGPGSGSDVRWHGRPDRTFEASVEIDISGFYTPLPGDFAGTDRGDIVFWDETRTSDTLWSN